MPTFNLFRMIFLALSFSFQDFFSISLTNDCSLDDQADLKIIFEPEEMRYFEAPSKILIRLNGSILIVFFQRFSHMGDEENSIKWERTVDPFLSDPKEKNYYADLNGKRPYDQIPFKSKERKT
jgi:hypothetical protein